MATEREPEPVRLSGIVAGGHKTEKRIFADQLRRNMTAAEAVLWVELRAGRLAKLHFRRQQIIDGFIIDFFCFKAGLVVEVDGSVHEGKSQEDADRTKALELRGLRVLRFSNARVLGDVASVLLEIEAVSLVRVCELVRVK